MDSNSQLSSSGIRRRGSSTDDGATDGGDEFSDYFDERVRRMSRTGSVDDDSFTMDVENDAASCEASPTADDGKEGKGASRPGSPVEMASDLSPVMSVEKKGRRKSDGATADGEGSGVKGQNRNGNEKDGNGNGNEDGEAEEDNEEEIAVFYLSPSHLRLRVDEVLLKYGESALRTGWMKEHRPHVYWNLHWYAARLRMPLPFIDEPFSEDAASALLLQHAPSTSNAILQAARIAGILTPTNGGGGGDGSGSSSLRVVTRTVAAWREDVVLRQCQWLLDAAERVMCDSDDSDGAPKVPSPPPSPPQPSDKSLSLPEPLSSPVEGAEEEQQQSGGGGNDEGKVEESSDAAAAAAAAEAVIPRAQFSHRGPDGTWESYSEEQNEVIAAAMMHGSSPIDGGGKVLLPALPGGDDSLKFEVSGWVCRGSSLSVDQLSIS